MILCIIYFNLLEAELQPKHLYYIKKGAESIRFYHYLCPYWIGMCSPTSCFTNGHQPGIPPMDAQQLCPYLFFLIMDIHIQTFSCTVETERKQVWAGVLLFNVSTDAWSI